jgi:monovalent cation:H+ antiporter-2, CPA2 family
MAAPTALESYKEVMFVLATAGIVVPLFHRLRVSPVLGFLGVGALLGPYGLGQAVERWPALRWITIANREEMSHLAEFGVVFLLFMIGLELSWERLRTMRRLVFGLGSLQVALSALAIGGAAALLGLEPTHAALLGLALALSSTAIVVPVLSQKRRLNAPAGRASFAILLFQDLAVAPILFTIGVLGANASGGWASTLLFTLAQAALAFALLVGVGRLALRPLFQLVAATRSPELFMAASLLVVLGTGLVAAASGLSMALGAFIAGLLLAETEYRRAIEATIDPFKGLLLGIFFLSVGMGLDLSRIAAEPLGILLAAAGLIAVKGLIVLGLALVFGLKRSVAMEAALLIGPGGEFAFVLIGSAVAAELLPYGIGQTALVVATVSMLSIPALSRLGLSVGRALERRAAPETAPSTPPPADELSRVIIGGYGRVGQLVGDMLARHGVPFLAIDADPARVAAERRAGQPVYFGDSASPDLLRACGIERARALVVTLDAPRKIEEVVAVAKGLRPDLTVVARARDARHATALYDLGVDDAVPETIEASLQLSEAVLVDVGVPMGLVIASVHERRDEFRRALKRSEAAPDAEAATPFHARRRRRAG